VRILVNTTSCRTGGTLQTSSAFITEALRDDSGIDWRYVVSPDGLFQLEQFGIQRPETMTVLEGVPASNRAARRELLAIEAKENPDCVLTFSGPAYVHFRSFHIVGCSAPWVTHASWAAFRSLNSVRDWAECIVRTAYKRYWFSQADAWIAQTETGARGLRNRLKLPADRITVISNTCGERYHQQQGEKPFPAPDQPIQLLFFSAPYKHKNFDILPDVARELEKRMPNRPFKFVVTLSPGDRICKALVSKAERLGVSDRIENAGPIPVARGPDMYRASDICFLPTLLETFSANYPEAMAMGVPIVTTDLDFARDVCDDAALYFEPQNAVSAADTLVRLLGDERLWKQQIAGGKRVLKRFPTPRERFEAYRDFLVSFRDQAKPARERVH
jgi:glycosyltransferase involved in cell wall biosynthesis